MIGYIYITTNTLNNMKYIGKHIAEVFEPDKYLGSNKHLLASIKKYGRNYFKCELLQECSSEEELNKAEQYWINFYDAVTSPLFYNIAHGGEGGQVMLNRVAINNGVVEKRIFKDETIPEGFVLGGLKRNNGKKVSAAKKGKPSKSKGKQWFNNGVIQTMANSCPEGWVAGRLHFVQAGKELYNNGVEHRYFTSTDTIPEGWVKGAIPGSRKSNTKGRIAYNNGSSHIYLAAGILPPEGFVPGYTAERKLENKKSASKYATGKRWYNDGTDQKYFSATDTIPEGWVPGCCKFRAYNKN